MEAPNNKSNSSINIYEQNEILSQSAKNFEDSIFITDNEIIGEEGKKIIKASYKRDMGGHFTSFVWRTFTNAEPIQKQITNWVNEQKKTYTNYIQDNFFSLTHTDITKAYDNLTLINKIITIADEKFAKGQPRPILLQNVFIDHLMSELRKINEDDLLAVEKEIKEELPLHKASEKHIYFLGKFLNEVGDTLKFPDVEIAEDFVLVNKEKNNNKFLKSKVKRLIEIYKGLKSRLNLLLSNPIFPVKSLELEKYGSKHANLIKMAYLTDSLNLPQVVIPIPHGLKSEEVETFLKKHCPEVFENWKILGQLYRNNKDNLPFFENAEVKKHLETIDVSIKKLFDTLGRNTRVYQELLPLELLYWLESMRESGNYLMVRSTGAEDSIKTANAGGNLSCSYVSPNSFSFAKALGDVIRSYFGISSLQNRMNAGLNPFEQDLKLAVTAQVLVGEPIGGSVNPQDIPISLVLFTNEPLYVGDELFRIMRISATYGHGEGVVGNRGIACDTVLVLQSQVNKNQLYILYDNKAKPERLAPLSTPNGIELKKIRNPSELKNQQVLDNELIAKLYEWGLIGEKIFGNLPTDMEIVIKGNTIYPVQARPINRPALLPTYLDKKKVAALLKNFSLQTIQSEILVPGQASVVVIKNSNQILYAQTLEIAEKAFKIDLHKVVVVTQPEPSNSHPVVNFSGLGIPCLKIENNQKFSELLDKLDKMNSPKYFELLDVIDIKPSIIVDMQLGEITFWEVKYGKVDDVISTGFAVHPAKIVISLPTAAQLSLNFKKQTTPYEVIDLMLAIRSVSTQKVGIAKLNELHNHPWIKQLNVGKEKLGSRLKELKNYSGEAKEIYQALAELNDKVERAFNEAILVLSRDNNSERLHSLFHAKVIESLLNVPKIGRGLGQLTIADVKPLMDRCEALIDYHQALPGDSHLSKLLGAGSHAVVPESTSKWKKFLLDLEPLVQFGEIPKKLVVQFHNLIHNLEKANLLPTWFALYFSKVSNLEISTLEKLKDLLNTMPEKDAPFLQYLEEVGQQLNEGEKNIELFSHPDSVDEGLKGLLGIKPKLISNAEIGNKETFEVLLKKSSSATQMMALSIMQKFVLNFDSSIKAMKGSLAFTPKQKTKLFKELLGQYFQILENWGTNLIDPGMIPMHADWSLAKYFQVMKNRLGHMPDDAAIQLSPSPSFNVFAAMLSSKTAFERHYPYHLDDMFTLIHQNLLAILSQMGQILYEDKCQLAELPNFFKETWAFIERDPKAFGTECIQRVGVDISEDAITVKFNIPLRNHSAQIWIEYNKVFDKVTFKGFLLGENHDKRWENCDFALAILNQANILTLSENPQLKNMEMNFSWDLKNAQSLSIAIEEFNCLCKMSLERNISKGHDVLHSLIQRRNITQDEINKIFIYFSTKGDLKYLHYPIIPYLSFEESPLNIPLVMEKNEETDQAFIEAFNRARKDFRIFRRHYTDILGAVLSEGRALKLAVPLIKGILEEKRQTKDYPVDIGGLLFVLVHNNLCYPEAIEYAEDKFTTNETASKLFLSLFKKGLAFDAAIISAQKGIKEGLLDTKSDIYKRALELFEELFKAGQGFDGAITTLLDLVAIPSSQDLAVVRINVFYTSLINAGKGKQLVEEADKRRITITHLKPLM